jgi:hypothetical protein
MFSKLNIPVIEALSMASLILFAGLIALTHHDKKPKLNLDISNRALLYRLRLLWMPAKSVPAPSGQIS